MKSKVTKALLCAAVTVSMTTSGCARRRAYQQYNAQPMSYPQAQTQPLQSFVTGPASAASQQMPIQPVPDVGINPGPTMSAPTGGGLPTLDISPMSAKPKRNLFRLLPWMKRKTPAVNQIPASGAVLTEEQFNALPGAIMQGAGGYPTTQMPQSAPASGQHRLSPIPDPGSYRSGNLQTSFGQPARTSGSANRFRPQPAAQQSARQPSVRTVSSERYTPAVVANNSKNFEPEMSMSFGGAWGDRVHTPPMQIGKQTVQQVQKLAQPRIDQNFDLWPGNNRVASTSNAMAGSDVNTIHASSAGEMATQLMPTVATRPATMMPTIVPGR